MNLKTMRAYNLRLALQEFWNIDDLTTASVYLQKWYLRRFKQYCSDHKKKSQRVQELK